VIVNSGNANCCTGEQGMQDALRMTQMAASELDLPEDDVLVASTGVIGEPLPMGKIESALPDLIQSLVSDGASDFAEAIMTTDTQPKVVSRQLNLGDAPVSLTGVAKGAGMICPNMATMLCFLMTDIQATPNVLQNMLKKAAEKSLNRITVDGDTSTNDTVLLLANGHSGVALDDSEQQDCFQALLDDVMLSLAKWLVKDAEGATKLVEIIVSGADSKQGAHQIANTVANSPLFKTALFGEDANWGRILAAVGRSGIPVDPHKIDILFGSTLMVKNGAGCGQGAEAEASKVLKQDEFSITINLNQGPAADSVYTSDFSLDYVRINADYRS
jgi:glutamate N-acetyltransferase/amino-acid N-acetyltransferase